MTEHASTAIMDNGDEAVIKRRCPIAFHERRPRPEACRYCSAIAEIGTSELVWNDALLWLPTLPDECAKAVIFDPPYAVGTPVRGREDGAAGSVFGPLSFMSATLRECRRILVPGGIVAIFADWRRMPDLYYVASTVGLRAATEVAWVRTRPGTGGLFRSSWDPIGIVSRGVPDAVDRAAIRNVVEANYPNKRSHPYEKPVEIYEHILRRVVVPGDVVIDPFAGSSNSRLAAEGLGAAWKGCDIDPDYVDAVHNGRAETPGSSDQNGSKDPQS